MQRRQPRGGTARLQVLLHDCSTGLKLVKWGMKSQKSPTRMQRFSVQVHPELLAGLQDLARRERQELQPMLREILQAVVDGDDPGRVVSAGTREAIDALRDERRRGEAALAQALMEAIENLQAELARGREEDAAETAGLTTAFRNLQERVDRLLDLQTPPGPDEARPGRLGRFFGGGG